MIIVQLKKEYPVPECYAGRKFLVSDSRYDEMEIKVGDQLKRWIPLQWIDKTVSEFSGPTSYNGELINKTNEIEATIRKANEMDIGELIIALIDALAIIKKQQKAIEHVMDNGLMSIKKMSKIMGCSVGELTKNM